MSKRSNGEGTIAKRRDGRWAGAVTLPDGRRKWLYGKTQSEVAKKIAATRSERDTGQPVSTTRRTVASYLTSWLAMIKPGVRPNTYRSYEYVTRIHLIPDLGKRQLSSLTPELIQRWLAQKQDEPSRATGKPLSSTTLRYLHTVLAMALGEATHLGITARNPAKGLRKPRRRRSEMKCWTKEQARAVLAAAKEVQDGRLYALFVLALSTGMRESELFGLRWRDVDLGKPGQYGSLRVQSQLQWKRSEHNGYRGLIPSFDEIKTESGRRHIRISRDVAAALRAHRARQREEQMKLGPIWRENDLVFCNAIGSGLLLTNFRRDVYIPAIQRAGVPYIRPHGMRHTAATLAILDGMPIKAVSEMLGHSSVAITMTIYAHVLPVSHAQVADAMAKLLFDEGDPEAADRRRAAGGEQGGTRGNKGQRTRST